MSKKSPKKSKPVFSALDALSGFFRYLAAKRRLRRFADQLQKNRDSKHRHALLFGGGLASKLLNVLTEKHGEALDALFDDLIKASQIQADETETAIDDLLLKGFETVLKKHLGRDPQPGIGALLELISLAVSACQELGNAGNWLQQLKTFDGLRFHTLAFTQAWAEVLEEHAEPLDAMQTAVLDELEKSARKTPSKVDDWLIAVLRAALDRFQERGEKAA